MFAHQEQLSEAAHAILKQGYDNPELACWRDHMKENQGGETEGVQTGE